MDRGYDDGNGVVPVHKGEYAFYECGAKLPIDPVDEMRRGSFQGAEDAGHSFHLPRCHLRAHTLGVKQSYQVLQ